MTKPKILLLSAYNAQSHEYWHQGLVDELSEYTFTTLTLPARHFSWRIRGNSLIWAHSHRETLSKAYDLVIATSMTDLSSLIGFVPELGKIPSILYCHENQFAYPESDLAHASIEPKILNLYNVYAADKVLFNSNYNRETFLAGARQMLRKMPDFKSLGILDEIDAKSEVLPVPLKSVERHSIHSRQASAPLHIVWNHRWEYDKGPGLLLAALTRLKQQADNDSTLDFRISIVGQQFRSQPAEFDQIKSLLAEHIQHFGYIEEQREYAQLLDTADVCLSTALHDFQGISMLEATARGCLPVLPKRLAYPEWFPHSCLYHGEDTIRELDALVTHLLGLIRLKQTHKMPTAPNVEHFFWDQLGRQYREMLSSMRPLA